MLRIEPATVEQQGRGPGPVVAAFYFTYKNDVVAFVVTAAVETLEGGNRTVQ